MPKLTVKNFSCIDEASLDLSELTVLIGPQASGKSVLSKLIYFFVDLLEYQLSVIEELHPLSKFSDDVKERFVEWFPISAWGSRKFSIHFVAGSYEVKISRNAYNKEVNDNIRLYLSPFFKKQYGELLDSLQKKSTGSGSRAKLSHEFERRFQLRRVSAKFLKDKLGKEFFSNQLFIPAGRSFFTSLGRAILAFEHGQILDPITMQFGRTFGSFRGHEQEFMSRSSQSFQLMEQLSELIGGKVHYESDKAYVLSKDGRKVPFSALSSGQQELLPLIMVLGVMAAWSDKDERQLLYIEEPEAHLFPLAQSKLVGILAAYVMDKRRSSTLVMTTHSPYVLAKLNTLLKAGQLSTVLPQKRLVELGSVIPASSWLHSGQLSAYALINGRAEDIVDDDGFIAADYLDDVSDVISREFSQLLDLEFTSAQT